MSFQLFLIWGVMPEASTTGTEWRLLTDVASPGRGFWGEPGLGVGRPGF